MATAGPSGFLPAQLQFCSAGLTHVLCSTAFAGSEVLARDFLWEESLEVKEERQANCNSAQMCWKGRAT